MSSSRRRHSEHLTLPDEQHGQLKAQPLVRTRSSAHLLFGQLTGTCTSLLRRLSLKVRYLSLSLVPPARPQSVDRVESKNSSGEPRAAGRVRPRRHTTTVATGCDEQTVGRRDSKRTAKQVDAKRADSDSDATPTPSTPVPLIALDDSCSPTVAEAHLLHPDSEYPTLRASGTSRRRRGGNKNNKRSQTEVSAGAEEMADAAQQPDEASAVSSSSSTVPLALDQSLALDLNLSALAPSLLLLDDYLAGHQEDADADATESLVSSHLSEQQPVQHESDSERSSVVQSPLGIQQRKNSAKNPYLDWYLNCGESPGTADEKSKTGAAASVQQQAEQAQKVQQLSTDLPYPIVLEDWDETEKRKAEEEPDPLAALHQHADWFEEYAFPAYAKAQTKATSAGGPPAPGSSRMMAEKAYPYVSSPPTVRQNKYAGYDPYDLLYDEAAYLAVPEVKPANNNNNNNNKAPVGVEPLKSDRSANGKTQSSGVVQQQPSLQPSAPSATVAKTCLVRTCCIVRNAVLPPYPFNCIVVFREERLEACDTCVVVECAPHRENRPRINGAHLERI